MASLTTAQGRAFQTYDFTSSYGEPALYAVADNRVGAKDIPLVIVCHGAGGDYNEFTNSYPPLRDWIIDNGGAYVEARGALKNWGSKKGVDAYRAAYDRVVSSLSVGPVALVGISMGGLAAVNLYLNEPVISARASGAAILSGTADLVYRYNTGSPDDQASLRAAYNAADTAAYMAAIKAYDPMQIPISKWAGKRVQHVVADGDTAVVAKRHGIPLRRRIATGAPAMNGMFVFPGGDHNSTQLNAAATPATTSFLAEVLGMNSRTVTSIRTNLPLS